MSSKFIGVMIILTFLLMSAATVFQYFEMRDYQLIEELRERFGGSADSSGDEEAASGDETAESGDAAAE